MTDIKAALQAEIENMESACDEIPFGLDEESEQCLSVMREALKELSQRDAQLADLKDELSGCNIARGRLTEALNDVKLYRAAPPAPVKLPIAKHFGVIGTDEVCRAYPADAVIEAIKAAGGSVADE